MSKLKDILDNYNFQVIAAKPEDTLIVQTDEARQQIKDLFKELIGEDINQSGEPDEYADGINRQKAIMRQKVDEL